MSYQTPSSGEQNIMLSGGLSYAEQRQVRPWAEWVLGEIRKNEQWLMSFDDLMETLEEDNGLAQNMIDEILTYLEVNRWAKRIQLDDGRWFMQGVYQAGMIHSASA